MLSERTVARIAPSLDYGPKSMEIELLHVFRDEIKPSKHKALETPLQALQADQTYLLASDTGKVRSSLDLNS